jgi:cytidylate kinase
MKKIVTISREFGSGGRFIGETLAKELGFSYYDKNIIAQVAEKTGFSEKYIEERGEYAPKKNIFSYAFIGRDVQGSSIDDYIYQTQRQIICDIAGKENCVIVGRCADYILRTRNDVLNVFIYGNEEEKCARIMKLYEKNKSEALAMMKDTDKKRSIHYSYYTDKVWGKYNNYMLCLNSSVLGYERCLRIIKEALQA